MFVERRGTPRLLRARKTYRAGKLENGAGMSSLRDNPRNETAAQDMHAFQVWEEICRNPTETGDKRKYSAAPRKFQREDPVARPQDPTSKEGRNPKSPHHATLRAIEAALGFHQLLVNPKP